VDRLDVADDDRRDRVEIRTKASADSTSTWATSIPAAWLTSACDNVFSSAQESLSGSATAACKPSSGNYTDDTYEATTTSALLEMKDSHESVVEALVGQLFRSLGSHVFLDWLPRWTRGGG
jgi:hypothetical protein